MTAQLAPVPIFKAFDNVGLPLAFGKLYAYQAGTTTPQATYTDSTGNTPNPNPIILNARGETPLWLNPTLNYKLLLTDALGNQISGWPVDNISGSLYPGNSIIPNTSNAYTLGNAQFSWANLYLGPNNAPVLDSVSGNIGYYARTAAEIAAGVTPVNYAYGPFPIDIRRYGADPTNTTDSTTSINNAISVVQHAPSASIYIPAGTYKITGQIVWKNGIVVFGDGMTRSILLSSYTSGDQNVILNPINSSTVANVTFRDLQFQSGSTNSNKANFADTGSSYLFFERVYFTGNGINLTLDQSEIVRIRDCLFDNVEANSIGLWLVNGAEHTAGANGLFTNEILVTGCQFNGPSTATLVADDGGHSHKFIGNNFNGGNSQIRVNQCSTLLVEANEMEAGINAVDFQVTKVGGNTGATSNSAKITENLFSVAGQNVFRIGGLTSSIQTLEFTDNCINSMSTPFISLQNIGNELISYGNTQIGTGDNYYKINNYWSAASGGPWTPTWSSLSGTAPTLGNGGITATYDRRGKQILCRMNQNMGSTTTFTGSTWTWTLPVTAANEGLNYIGTCYARVAGNNSNAGMPTVQAGASTIFIQASGGGSNFGSAVPGAWASGDAITLAFEYKAANWVN